MRAKRVTIIGAGAGGLAAAIDLAARGAAVTLLDSAARPGGKLRQARPAALAGAPSGRDGIDSGPTVFTMRWVFEQLFADAGTSLEEHVSLSPLALLARHAWNERDRLDLFASVEHTAEAIGAFAGAAEAAGYRSFCARAARVYRTLEQPFIRAAHPTALSVAASSGLRAFKEMSPFATLWRALGEHFHDPRLRQLFARYATYSGSSPFLAPATLMLIAHVEQQGVWSVDGGMARLAEAMANLAVRLGAKLRLDATVARIEVRDRRARGVVLASGERIDADAVICAADAAALATGLFGPDTAAAVPREHPAGRSLSAITWALSATTSGFPLTRHNVFFSRDYAAEFDAIFRRGKPPSEPTVYVCAQDRGVSGDPPAGTPERLLVLINAPANGDQHEHTATEIEQCATTTFGLLARCGLRVERTPEATIVTGPSEFAQLYPATGGALYGQAVHGAMAAFCRPAARSSIPGLYLAGGSVHPGPGVPMATLSGRLAAARVWADLTLA